MLCVPVCAPDDAIIHSRAKRAIGWDQPIIIVRSITPLRIFMAAWASIIFDEPTACRTNHFGFSIGSYPPELPSLFDSRRYKRKGSTGSNYKLPPLRNGPITTCVRLACALRYFAGASSYDIMAKYGISKKSVSESVWAVVDAVNNLDEFIIEYPDTEEVQLMIAHKFQCVSEVNFSNCAGAIDGILI